MFRRDQIQKCATWSAPFPAQSLDGAPALGPEPEGLGPVSLAIDPEPIAVGYELVALGPEPISLGPELIALGPEPVTLISKLISLGPEPVTLISKLISLGHEPITLGHEPMSLGPEPMSLGHEPIALGHELLAMMVGHFRVSVLLQQFRLAARGPQISTGQTHILHVVEEKEKSAIREHHLSHNEGRSAGLALAPNPLAVQRGFE
jgi:hypothetical protein